MSKFIDLLPYSIRRDEAVINLADVLDSELTAIDELIKKLSIYADIDNLDEQYIDELAHAFHLEYNEGYQFADTLAKKKALVKTSLNLHKHKGTLYAVKTVCELLGLDGVVEEWFNYDESKPYYFKLDISLQEGLSFETMTKLYNLIEEFKNVRSKLDTVVFHMYSSGYYHYSGYAEMGAVVEVLPYQVGYVEMVTRANKHTSTHVYTKLTI